MERAAAVDGDVAGADAGDAVAAGGVGDADGARVDLHAAGEGRRGPAQRQDAVADLGQQRRAGDGAGQGHGVAVGVDGRAADVDEERAVGGDGGVGLQGRIVGDVDGRCAADGRAGAERERAAAEVDGAGEGVGVVEDDGSAAGLGQSAASADRPAADRVGGAIVGEVHAAGQDAAGRDGDVRRRSAVGEDGEVAVDELRAAVPVGGGVDVPVAVDVADPGA